ncbi:MAG TPA: chaperonin GroEL [Polyangia bacterium]|nr:chaperonin GroEL [Polyangia bacterium]
MAAKRILFGDEGRARLLKGSRMLAGAVRSTLGPGGRNILLERPMHGSPLVTRDGVTVAENIDLHESFANMGAQLVLETAVKTGNTAGDGTTTSTVLAHVLFREGNKLVAAGHHPLGLKRGIDLGVERVVAALVKGSKPVRGRRDIAKVATVSSNGDSSIGALIADAVEAVGLDGIIHVEQGVELQTKLEVSEGTEVDRGYSSMYFITDPERLIAQLDDAYILMTAQKIGAIHDLVPILEKVSRTGRSLLVVGDVQGEALSLLVVNKLQGTLKVCAILPPFHSASRQERLGDLAVQTGGRIIGEEGGISFADLQLEDLGFAKKVVVDREKTIIVGGRADEGAVEARARQLRALHAETNSPLRRQLLEERLRRLVGGAALIRVGGTTDAETHERKLRLEDALFATRAAIQEGIVPGGGVALVRAAAALAKPDAGWTVEEAAGVALVRRACEEPCRQIASNAGRDPSLTVGCVQRARGAHGYNVATGKFEDLVAAGVVDPTMVVRLALQNAASIAGLMLSTEVMIADAPRAPVDFPESGSGADALSVDPFVSRRDRRAVGGRT